MSQRRLKKGDYIEPRSLNLVTNSNLRQWLLFASRTKEVGRSTLKKVPNAFGI